MPDLNSSVCQNFDVNLLVSLRKIPSQIEDPANNQDCVYQKPQTGELLGAYQLCSCVGLAHHPVSAFDVFVDFPLQDLLALLYSQHPGYSHHSPFKSYQIQQKNRRSI